MNDTELDEASVNDLIEDLESLALIIDEAQTKAVITMLSGAILADSAKALASMQEKVKLLEARNASLQRQVIDLTIK